MVQSLKALGSVLDRFTYSLPESLNILVQATIEDWRSNDKIRRLWERDSSLWTGQDEGQWLGWLDVSLADLDSLKQLTQDVKAQQFEYILLLGMGGSSLNCEVMQLVFGHLPDYPELHILDSTDPAEIQDVEHHIDSAKTLFIVSSKSGSTLEPHLFREYFFDLVKQLIGKESVGERMFGVKAAGERFIAITDPGSPLQQIAERDRFRHLFFGVPSVGGRYSALSNFGIVPAAAMGVDVARFLDSAQEMVQSCLPSVPDVDNPGLILGAILGTLANHGRDKVTLILSAGIEGIGAWLAQLLAESTGKEGTGLIPVNQEPLAVPELYGNDRLFVYIRQDELADPTQDAAVTLLERAGHPVVRIAISDPYQLGQEFFRWEMATAITGSILGINPFNQPDVEASKRITRQLTTEYETTGMLPAETPIWVEAGMQLFTDTKNAAALNQAVGDEPSLQNYLRAHLDRLMPGDYFALLAYIRRNESHQVQLQLIRRLIRDRKRVATCLGFGSRFLNSTGQVYKGGANTGVFLQLTCDDTIELSVPGQNYSFGVVKAAQARGDFQVLVDRARRSLRVHLQADVEVGLSALITVMRQILV
jgi:transaldolase/glucose-6-phosphate isomerase